MTVAAYVAELKRIKAYIDGQPTAGDKLKESFAADQASFRQAFTPDALKSAMAANASLPSDLEEHITSTIILMNDDRFRR